MVMKCRSCGMPMTTPGQHAGGNPRAVYCGYCAARSGKIKPFPQVLEGMTNFLVINQGLPKVEARKAAKAYLLKMPAWRAAMKKAKKAKPKKAKKKARKKVKKAKRAKRGKKRRAKARRRR